MVALLILPIVIEIVTRGVVCRCTIEGGTYILWSILADGEMSALAWLPCIIAAILLGAIKPASLPPERREYITKRQRQSTEESGGWFWKNIPTWMSKSDSHQLNAVGARKVLSFPYDKYSRKKSRESGRRINRKMAISMRLVTVTCMMASSIGRSAAFHSDSKPIAIDNCSSRCLTNSGQDFLPGIVRRCNVSVSGVGGLIKCKTKGTVSWTIEDDQGWSHDVLIPDTPMCTMLPNRLFSPQHWAQEIKIRVGYPFWAAGDHIAPRTQTQRR
jgi:hypothetical protein